METIFINEWLPNPAGSDTAGEWVELWNDGKETVNLNGWVLVSGGGSKTKLSGAIGSKEYLVLKRPETKLVLKNTDEGLFLYDASGKLVDRSTFLGSAPEGESFSRLNYSVNSSQNFAWSEPTPGAANEISLDMGIIQNEYPANIPLNKNLGGMEVFALAVGTAAVLTALVIYILNKSELIKSQDENIS